jgi:excisionase family DNA binding protein
MQAYRVTTLAQRWDCSAAKIRGMVAKGEIACLRIGKLIRIPIATVTAFEAQWTTNQGSAASPAEMPGTFTTGGAASLRDARIARKLSAL